MVDMSAIAGAMSSLNAAVNITKAMKDLKDWSAVQTQVIELQRAILDAQGSLFSANEERASLMEKMREAEKRIADLETWNLEKRRYQLTEIGDGNFAFALKESMSNGEPAHYICTACHDISKKAILQHFETGGGVHHITCPKCPAKIVIDRDYRPPSYLRSEEDMARAGLEKCPVCQTGRLHVMAINPHPTHGVLGIQEKDLVCDRCEHTESRWHDPKKTR